MLSADPTRFKHPTAMAYPDAPPNDLDSLVARRARWRADGRRPLERSEPTIGSAHRAQDADILEVVQKFELVYSQFSADQRQAPRRIGTADLSGSNSETREASPDRDNTDSASMSAEPPSRVDFGILPVAPEPPIEKFELPEILDSLPRSLRRPSPDGISLSARRTACGPRYWPVPRWL